MVAKIISSTTTCRSLLTFSRKGINSRFRSSIRYITGSSVVQTDLRQSLLRKGPCNWCSTTTSPSLLNFYHDDATRKGTLRRYFSSDAAAADGEAVPREAMYFDVCIVGAGPAGLASAIHIKQLCAETGKNLSVCLVEKGSEIGSHILSGNVFEPRALDELLPNWREEYAESEGRTPVTPVTTDSFLILSETGSVSIPQPLLPKDLHNEGNYVISLGQLCRWLGEVAEALGVEIYPGFSASEILYSTDNTGILGVATRDVGIGKDGSPKSTFERGVELRARQTLFAEGARGSCSEELISKFKLRDGRQPQTYGLGIKEVWEIPAENFKPGFVQHTLGWPLQSSFFDKTFGGTFLYHQEPNFVLAGLVVGLDYENPYLNPYKEFQRWKTHPEIRKHFEGGQCVAYGARVLNEGGFHSIPKLTFPGGALLGCAAGFLNSVKIKGTHTAIKSGMEAGKAVFHELTKNDSIAVEERGVIAPDEPISEIAPYEISLKESWVFDELHQVRNTHAAFQKWGLGPGLMYAALESFFLKGREPWTIHHTKLDSQCTGVAKNFKEISYPSPDGILTFDLLTNLQRAGMSLCMFDSLVFF
jgi:electron-transferring-flavoprotein dehydrogenase